MDMMGVRNQEKATVRLEEWRRDRMGKKLSADTIHTKLLRIFKRCITTVFEHFN